MRKYYILSEEQKSTLNDYCLFFSIHQTVKAKKEDFSKICLNFNALLNLVQEQTVNIEE